MTHSEQINEIAAAPQWWRVRFVGRKVGAIGIVYPIEVDRIGSTSADVESGLYLDFEHITGLTMRPLNSEEADDAL